MSVFSAAVLLFLVMDPLGNIPLFVTLLKDVEPRQRPKIIVREHCIALALLTGFLFGGRYVMRLFGIEAPALSIAGAIVLFLIALRMIFPTRESMFGEHPEGEPFIVPLAIPLIAGPSALSTVMLLASREEGHFLEWFAALTAAWAASLIVLLLSGWLSRLLGERLVVALERLMGMILTAIAVQMLLNGVQKFLVK